MAEQETPHTHKHISVVTHLITHLNQTAKGQLQDHTVLEGDKVSHILQEEESWAVVLTVAEVRDNKRVLQGTHFQEGSDIH